MVATVVTQVLVDRNDPSFQKPSQAHRLVHGRGRRRKQHREKDGWDIVEDAGRGCRRVVASPRPKQIVELEAIQRLLEDDIVVVAVGGGGIPVVEDERRHPRRAPTRSSTRTSPRACWPASSRPTCSSSRPRSRRSASTSRSPTRRTLDRITLAEAKQYLAEGHFAPGSMKPKIEAVIEFLEGGGKEALITDPPHLVRALEGKTGTWIVA